MGPKEAKSLAIRYLLIIAAALLGSYLYYALLPITIYPVYFILNLFYSTSIIGNLLVFDGKEIEIIRACVGASAISLLLILNLATPSIKMARRASLALASILLFLAFNWTRIIILDYLYLEDYLLFGQMHLFSWYFASTVAVALIWIFCARCFNIKDIPFWSDVSYLLKKSRK